MPDERLRERQRQRPNHGGGGSDFRNNGDPPGSGSGGIGKGGLWAKVAGAIAVLAVAGSAFWAFSGSSDSLTESEMNDRTAAYQTLVAGAGLPLALVSAADLDRAIDSMPENVTPEQRTEIRQQVESGQTRLAWVTLWDTHAEDGDILRFESSASFPLEVTALNTKTTFAIPYPADGNVLVTGVYDGGGGITIALESGAAQIAWPTMQPGDSLRLPVIPGN